MGEDGGGTPRGDVARAIEFLNKIRPGGPWALRAAPRVPDFSAQPQWVAFDEARIDGLTEWLAAHDDGAHSVVARVNPCDADGVREVRWLHADVRVAEASKLREDLPTALPGPPTIVVEADGWLHALWRLADPIPIGPGGETAEDAALYNAEIASLLGGDPGADSLHSCSRSVRLPGTVVPVSGGAGYVVAALWADGSAYPSSAFRKAARVRVADDAGFSSGVVPFSRDAADDPARVESVDHLHKIAGAHGGTIDAYVVDLAANGYDPDDPRNAERALPQLYRRQQDAAFAVACALVRAKVPDEHVASLLCDRRFGISAYALTRARPGEHARRQVARAHQYVESPDLLELNDRHAIISDLGGRCVVVTEVEQDGRRVISKQSFQNFKDRYVKRRIQVGEKKVGRAPAQITIPEYIGLGEWWLRHPMGNQFERIVFSPGRDVPGCYNLWRGFAVEPRPGDCSLYLDHVRENVCAGDPMHYEYVLNWMARAVQRPDLQGYTAIVVRGRQRTGKTFFGQWFGKLFGAHTWHISSAELLVGRFNAHLRDCVVVLADEAFYAGDKRHESQLKMLITQEIVPYEPKGVDAEMGPNYTHIIMSSDKDWVVPVGLDEERFFILNCSDARMNDHAYFAAIARQMSDGGLEALLYHLLHRDVSRFEVRAVPRTEALIRQRLYSLSDLQEWWYHKLNNGRLLPGDLGWVNTVRAELLQQSYAEFAEQNRIMRPATPVRIGMFLSDVCGIDLDAGANRRFLTYRGPGPEYKMRRAWHYVLPDLDTCRQRFERHLPGYRWPDIDESPDDRDSGQPRLPVGSGEQDEVPF